MYGKMPCLLEDAEQRQKGAMDTRTTRNYSKKGC
jgi:hypothetical protein